MALRGLKIEIDESGNGAERGVSYWKVGDEECEVLERFVQEVEFSHEFSQGKVGRYKQLRKKGGGCRRGMGMECQSAHRMALPYRCGGGGEGGGEQSQGEGA
jgi:hypothetical protein